MSEGTGALEPLVRENEALRRRIAELEAATQRSNATLCRSGDVVIAADPIGTDEAGRHMAAAGVPTRSAGNETNRVAPAFPDQSDLGAATQALQEREAFLRQLTESLPHLVWTCLADGPCDFLSRQWVEYTGIPEADQLGYGWLEQLHPDDRERVIAEWNGTVGAGVAFDIQFRIRRHDGAFRWFKTRAVPMRDAAGRIAKWYGSNTDVEDFKQTEESLRQSERRLSIRNRIARICLSVADDDMYSEVLKVLLEVTRSEFGVFGFIDEHGALVVPSMTRDIWDQCRVPGKNIVFPRDAWGDSIWPRAILQKQTLFSNEPSTRTPNGHVEILRNISTPILHRGGVVGLFQVANKATDYDPGDIQMLEAMADYLAPVLAARLQRDRQEKARQQATERAEHLTAVLRAIRNVNQLIVREKDPARLIQQACEMLVETRGYEGVWLATADSGGSPAIWAHAGWGQAFDPVARLLEQGRWPKCRERAQQTQGGLATFDLESDCKPCSLWDQYSQRQPVVAALRHDGRDLGLVGLAVPGTMTLDADEMSLIAEVASDLAFALRSLEVEAERRRAEAEIRNQLEELQRWHDATLGREGRIQELKREINRLLAAAGQPPRFTSVADPEQTSTPTRDDRP